MKAIALAPGLALAASLSALADEAGPRHLIYLHGRVVQEQQDARPRHPEWGYYELEKILATFRERGFLVTGEIRPKGQSVSAAADGVVAQVKRLLGSGVPPQRVIVVGGSMGAAIALLASVRLQNPELRLAVLGACMSRTVPLLVEEHGARPAGRILSFRETSDETSEPCPAWSEAASSSLRVREVVLSTGLHHGFLYLPLPQWVEPVVGWASED
jgi:hypothetical protein